MNHSLCGTCSAPSSHTLTSRVRLGDFDPVPIEVEYNLSIHNLKKLLIEEDGIFIDF